MEEEKVMKVNKEKKRKTRKRKENTNVKQTAPLESPTHIQKPAEAALTAYMRNPAAMSVETQSPCISHLTYFPLTCNSHGNEPECLQHLDHGTFTTSEALYRPR
jgi:hypothetical protein